MGSSPTFGTELGYFFSTTRTPLGATSEGKPAEPAEDSQDVDETYYDNGGKKPERVSKDFRSSTDMILENGIRVGVGRALRATSVVSTATAVMPLLLLGSGHAGSLR